MPKRNSEDERMLQELLETATGLNAYGVMTKQDMTRINLLCQAPPEYTPDRVGMNQLPILSRPEA